jgi:hypothetical protein
MYDHELYEEVRDTIRSCESELGMETLDFNEALALTDEAGDMGSSFLNLSSACELDESNTTDKLIVCAPVPCVTKLLSTNENKRWLSSPFFSRTQPQE